jgi:hypothetical protein
MLPRVTLRMVHPEASIGYHLVEDQDLARGTNVRLLI